MANASNLHEVESTLNQNEVVNPTANNTKHSQKNNVTQNSSKRFKSDILESTLQRYLGRRKYNYKVENHRVVLPDDNYSSTRESNEISKLIVNNNLITFSYVNIDTNMLGVIDQIFTKLENYVQNLKNASIKEELFAIMPVMLCHLYLEILKGIDKSTALCFLDKHLRIFLKAGNLSEDHSRLLLQLRTIVTVQDIANQPLLALFRSNKHITNISQKTATVLQHFLAKNGHSIILHILNKWFHYELKPLESNLAVESDGENICDKEASARLDHGEIENMEYQNSDDFLDIVTNLKKIKLTRITNLLNADGATCAVSDYYTGNKAIGLQNSEIVLVRNNLDYVRLEPDSSEERLEVQRLRGHGHSITDLKFVQKGGLLLSSSQDHTIRLWSMISGKCINIYTGHQYPVWSLDVSPNEQYFASGSFDNTARLWSLDRRHPVRLFTAHTQSVQCVAFHKNGKYVATGSRDCTVRLFSILDGSVLRLLSDATSPIYCIAFSPDGKLIAGAGEDGIIYIWDLGNGVCLYILIGHTGTICCITWDVEENLYTGSTNGEVKVWTKQNEEWLSNDLYSEDDYKRIINVEIPPFRSGSHIYAIPTNENLFS